jgi:hypothetical protein
MSKSKRNISVASTASALALLALSGTALAQETADDTYDSQATDTQTQSTDTQSQGMESSATNPAMGAKDDPQQIATTLGVSELNDIENWKVTSGGTELGEIDRLGVDRATGEILAVVALSGVVGANMKEVAVPLKNLTKAADETLSTDLSKDELQKERDIDPWDGSYSQVIKEDTTQ